MIANNISPPGGGSYTYGTSCKRSGKGTILIAALWIVAILTVFAVGVGRQSAISLKITSYNIDRLKAYHIARAGTFRALAEKKMEYNASIPYDIDALSEEWASNSELFDHRKFGSGDYTVSYKQDEETAGGERPAVLFGLMDEQSRININTAPKETLAYLMEHLGIDYIQTREIASAIVDWRDEDDAITLSEADDFYGAEDAYYQSISPPYHCKNAPFDNIYELLLVRGMTPEIFTDIKDHITVYGDGRVNINTAGETVLNGLFGPVYPNLAYKIVRYRQGADDIIGTDDDRWFCLGPYVIDRKDKGLVEIKNLQDAEWYANIYGIATEEYNRIRELIAGGNPQLCISSNTYRAIVSAEVDRVKAVIESVWLFKEKEKPPIAVFWYQE